MITLQHSLVTLLNLDGDIKSFKKEIPYVLLPDAIRAYSGPRQYSHFEESADGHDVSWMQFPVNVKRMSKNKMGDMGRYLVSDIPNCCIGEKTNLDTFFKYNTHLRGEYRNGVIRHLTQDIVFDDFVREEIDCSRKYDGIFVLQDGTVVDDKGVRKDIATMEQQGVYQLAKMVYDKYHIVANQEWFDNNVLPALQKVYPSDLAENTYKYMKIDSEINECITACDFSKIDDYKVSSVRFCEMYEKAIAFSTEVLEKDTVQYMCSRKLPKVIQNHANHSMRKEADVIEAEA